MGAVFFWVERRTKGRAWGEKGGLLLLKLSRLTKRKLVSPATERQGSLGLLGGLLLLAAVITPTRSAAARGQEAQYAHRREERKEDQHRRSAGREGNGVHQHHHENLQQGDERRRGEGGSIPWKRKKGVLPSKAWRESSSENDGEQSRQCISSAHTERGQGEKEGDLHQGMEIIKESRCISQTKKESSIIRQAMSSLPPAQRRKEREREICMKEQAGQGQTGQKGEQHGEKCM